MQPQSFTNVENAQQQEQGLFPLLAAIRRELVRLGVTVGIPRQCNDDDSVIAYKQELTAPDQTTYSMVSKLAEEGGLVMRISVFSESGELVLCYLKKLGATVEDNQSFVCTRLREAQQRAGWLAQQFEQAYLSRQPAH